MSEKKTCKAVLIGGSCDGEKFRTTDPPPASVERFSSVDIGVRNPNDSKDILKHRRVTKYQLKRFEDGVAYYHAQ